MHAAFFFYAGTIPSVLDRSPSIIGKVYNLKGYKPLTAMYGRASEQSRISESNSAVSYCIKERYFTALDGDGLPYRIGTKRG